MRHLKSLREFLDALRAIGELQELDCEADWNLETGLSRGARWNCVRQRLRSIV